MAVPAEIVVLLSKSSGDKLRCCGRNSSSCWDSRTI